MRAALCPRYGSADHLVLSDVPDPIPGPLEVRVRAICTTVQSGDWRVRSGTFPHGFGLLATLAVGLRGPRQPILGTEVAGIVDAVGSGVTRFRVGDAVFAFGDARMRCHAELRCFSQDGLIVHKPNNITFEQAAALSFGGTTALHVLRRAKLKAGDRVLVNGASGTVGSAVLQLARASGARVTAVCSTNNVEWVRALGAEHVIDYQKEDFAKGTERYDLIVDTAGTAPYARSHVALAPQGQLALVLATLNDNLAALWINAKGQHRVHAGPTFGTPEAMQALADAARAGTFVPVIGARFDFEHIADAHRLVEAGHKRGNVVVSFDARATTTGVMPS